MSARGASADSDRRWLAGALAVIVAFMASEVAVVVIAGSLLLLCDATHVLTDMASIALALFAIRLAPHPASGEAPTEWNRVEILSAQTSELTLLLLRAVWAMRRSRGLTGR